MSHMNVDCGLIKSLRIFFMHLSGKIYTYLFSKIQFYVFKNYARHIFNQFYLIPHFVHIANVSAKREERERSGMNNQEDACFV